MNKVKNAIVVGAGCWGTWVAIKLLESGWRVTLIDKDGPGNEYAGSGGYSRITRLVYGKDDLYSQMTLDSFPSWELLETFSNESVETIPANCNGNDERIFPDFTTTNPP